MSNSENNKRIAKNTLMLYIRMFITLSVSLYTSRVLLKILGVDDFGIYNIIGGVVVLFSFLSNAMTNSTQRFLNYNVGLNNESKIKELFCVSLQAHFLIALLIFFLSETIGLWFVNTHLNIPQERMYAANWVYHLSVLSTCINVMRVPYNAVVIAYEKMSFYAYVSIVETLLKLVVVYVLIVAGNIDYLIFYAVLLVVVSIVILLVYRVYCRTNYVVCRYSNVKSKKLFGELFSFTSWYLLGGTAIIGSRQGVNILLNLFFNVSVNAAVGIANQVKNAIYIFVTSFQTAFNPQIVKLYARDDRDGLLKLLNRATKFSFLLMYLLSLPVIMCSQEILSLWLEEVPYYAVIFTQLTIITMIFDAISAPLWTVIGATGHVKYYQIWVSAIIILDIPLAYLALYLGSSPEYVFLLNIVVNAFAYIFRFMYARKYVEIPVSIYLKKVIYPCFGVVLTSLSLALLVSFLSNCHWGIVFIVTTLSVLFSTFFIGLDSGEKKYLYGIILRNRHS